MGLFRRLLMSDNEESKYLIKNVQGRSFALQEFDVEGKELEELEPTLINHFFDVQEIRLISKIGNETIGLEEELRRTSELRKGTRGDHNRLSHYLTKYRSPKFDKTDRRLKAKLKTMLKQYDSTWGDPLDYFILGSSKPIDDIVLEISTTEKEEEYMVVDCSEEYIYEDQVLPSNLTINVLLHKSNFDELVNSIKDNHKQFMRFSCDISGCYSTRTFDSYRHISAVKLLTEKAMEMIEGIDIPKVGVSDDKYLPHHLNRALTDPDWEGKDKFTIITSTDFILNENVVKEPDEKNKDDDEVSEVDD